MLKCTCPEGGGKEPRFVRWTSFLLHEREEIVEIYDSEILCNYCGEEIEGK